MQPFALCLIVLSADLLTPVETWWREAKMWTLMYRGGLLAGACAAVAFVVCRVATARRERTRLEKLVTRRTRQLRQSELLFRSIFEHATEGIFHSSLDGHNLRANPAMAQLCGYMDSEQMQRELTEVAIQFYVDPARRQEINAAVARDGSAVGWESEVRRRDGSTFWVSESVRTVVDPASGQTVYQGSIVDITTRRAMQAAQDQARLAAEAANAAKTAFLTHVTHELRTPLNGILSNARVALRDQALNATNRSRYGLIVSSGEHLLTLIDEVLDFSRIEAGHMDLRPHPFSLGELLHTVADAFQARAVEKRLEFRYSVDPVLMDTMQSDALRLRQVLDNLLGNAFKFTAQGSITLDVRHGGSEKVIFEVTDTGIGIAADQCAAIFEPFRQAAAPCAPGDGGVGLGLPIALRLVRPLGGELRVESVPGRGSRFFFDLPLPSDGRGDRVHGVTARQSSNQEEMPPTMVALPPSADLQTLLTLSLQGDIIGLRTQLKDLAADNPAYGDFAREIEALIADFRMDAITEYLRRVNQGEGASEQAAPSCASADGRDSPVPRRA